MYKKKIFIFLLFYFFSVTNVLADRNSFCSGFSDGFKKGNSYQFKTALVPLCPLQGLRKLGDPSDSYGHGFNVGLRKVCGSNSICFQTLKK